MIKGAYSLPAFVASDRMSAPYLFTAGILVEYIQTSIPKVQILSATIGARSPVEKLVLVVAIAVRASLVGDQMRKSVWYLVVTKLKDEIKSRENAKA